MTKTSMFILLAAIMVTGCQNKTEIRNSSPQSPGGGASAELKGLQKEASAAPLSAETTKENHPPQVTGVDVTPLYPKPGDTLKVMVTTSDADGDEVRLSYQWSKNDAPLSETSSQLSLEDGFVRGDRIALNVTPDDGTAQGNPGRMTVTVGNTPPEITSSANDGRVVNGTYTYQITATDKDNDPLTYSLKSGPAGMTVNASTGLVQWNIPTDFKGSTMIVVSAADGHGGEAVQNFTFEMATGKPLER